jgi:molecular chaperone DnaJ
VFDPYETLSVRKTATIIEVRRAYQKLARRHHPDINPGDPIAAERFRLILSAFEILTDPKRRAAFDRGERDSEVRGGAQEVGFAGFDFSADAQPGRGDFQELFDDVDGHLAPASADQAVRGEDIEQVVRISFEEAFQGAPRRFQIMRQDACPICRGSGLLALAPIACPRCQGTGQLRVRRGRMIFTRRCADCDASGQIRARPCARCSGEGRLAMSESIDVGIPPGAGEGQSVRLPGGGHAGRRGGPAGDLVLKIEVEAHPFYRRSGADLHCVVPVLMTEAALGGHVEVPTPDGPVSIEIPAGAQSGRGFRLRKRGMPKFEEKGRGDLHVELRVIVPRVDDERGQRLLRELAEIVMTHENPRRGLPYDEVWVGRDGSTQPGKR